MKAAATEWRCSSAFFFFFEDRGGATRCGMQATFQIYERQGSLLRPSRENTGLYLKVSSEGLNLDLCPPELLRQYICVLRHKFVVIGYVNNKRSYIAGGSFIQKSLYN